MPEYRVEVSLLPTDEGGRRSLPARIYAPNTQVFSGDGTFEYCSCGLRFDVETTWSGPNVATLMFLNPEAPFHLVNAGDRLPIMEGPRIVGEMLITGVLEPHVETQRSIGVNPPSDIRDPSGRLANIR